MQQAEECVSYEQRVAVVLGLPSRGGETLMRTEHKNMCQVLELPNCN